MIKKIPSPRAPQTTEVVAKWMISSDLRHRCMAYSITYNCKMHIKARKKKKTKDERGKKTKNPKHIPGSGEREVKEKTQRANPYKKERHKRKRGET